MPTPERLVPDARPEPGSLACEVKLDAPCSAIKMAYESTAPSLPEKAYVIAARVYDALGEQVAPGRLSWPYSERLTSAFVYSLQADRPGLGELPTLTADEEFVRVHLEVRPWTVRDKTSRPPIDRVVYAYSVSGTDGGARWTRIKVASTVGGIR